MGYECWSFPHYTISEIIIKKETKPTLTNKLEDWEGFKQSW